jgi:hypothetical protein
MSTPKVQQPVKMQAPVEIDDSQVVSARDEAIRRAKGKGYLGTILTGFVGASGGASGGKSAPANLKQILGQ